MRYSTQVLPHKTKCNKEHINGAIEMALWLRVLIALEENPGVVPSIHIRWLTTAYNSNTLSDLCGHLHSCGVYKLMQAHVHARAHTHTL